MKFLIVTIAYGLIFVVVELLAKKLHPPSEATRKLSHILAGIGAALLPFVLNFYEIMLLGIIFVPAVFISMRRNMFRSVHGVKRDTRGELYFPLAIAVCAFLFPDQLAYTYGVLVIGISDALASLLGQKYGRKKYKVPSGKKSYVGSGVFFAATVLIGITLILSFMDAPIWAAVVWSVVLAGILTLVEARAKKGMDNLLVPVVGSGLLMFLVAIGFLNN